MACENCSDDMRSVTRHHNRALRIVNRNLRKKVERVGQNADHLFNALCETNVEAELSLREIWERGGFQPPIGPNDYREIVERCVSALQAQIQRDSHTSPVSNIGTNSTIPVDLGIISVI